MVGGEGGVPLGGVAGVGGGQLVGVDLGLGPVDAAGGLEPRQPGALGLADQPVAGRHRRAVVEQRRVAEDDGRAVGVADDDLEVALDRPAEQGRDRGSIGLRGSATTSPCCGVSSC